MDEFEAVGSTFELEKAANGEKREIIIGGQRKDR